MVASRDPVDAAMGVAEASLEKLRHGGLDQPTRWGPVSRVVRRIGRALVRAQTDNLVAAVAALTSALREERSRAAELRAEVGSALGMLLQRNGAGELLRPLNGAVASGDQVREELAGFMRNLGGRTPSAIDNPPVTTVATDVGDLMISAEDEAILYYLRRDGTWEPSEGDAIEAAVNNGMVALDIGAHVGYRTLQMARRVGPSGTVIAVEAAPSNFRLLAANVALSGLNNVFLAQVAAGDRPGRASLSISRTNTGDNRLSRIEGESGVSVEVVRLDDLLPPEIRIGVVKCDVQGFEYRALRGMEQTLRRCRPVVIVEFCPGDVRDAGEDPVAVLRFYRELGYGIEIIGHADASSADTEIVAVAERSEFKYVNLRLTHPDG